MIPSLRDLYNKQILELNARPLNFGPLADPSCEATSHNPLCGDQVTLRLRVHGDVITDARFEGQGCAVSRASASLLTAALCGKTKVEALGLAGALDRFLSPASDSAEADRALLGEIACLEGLREVPARRRCATLPWEALRACLKG
ncbi:MAG: SUF system NifU family Fe-S cluster assembly protein [Byssovorax sp.]